MTDFSNLLATRVPPWLESYEHVILNVGSGGKPYREAVNLDVYPARVQSRRTQVPPHVYADAHNLPFRDGVFELCTIVHTLEHLMRPYDAMVEVRRVLMDDGHVLVEVPFPRDRREKMSHLYSWGTFALSNFLKVCGFGKITGVHKVLDRFGLHQAHHSGWTNLSNVGEKNHRVVVRKREPKRWV